MAVLSFTACEQEKSQPIANPADYNAYLTNEKFIPESKYFKQWNGKIRPDSTQALGLAIVAGEYNRYFKTTGDIAYLKNAEKSLLKAVEHGVIGKSNYLRALARNYISQHRFKEADSLARLAREIGSGVRESQALLFDTSMELGAYKMAEGYLDSLKNIEDFGYLVRLAKFNDYKGDLDTAIRILEKAAQKANNANNKTLQLWSITNLADYYGHAGRISEAYNLYLKALSIDPSNAYAKKGIAWIAYSHDNNPDEALRILDSVTGTNNSPDYYLLKAEIAGYAGMEGKKAASEDFYSRYAGKEEYGVMYNIPNIELMMEKNPVDALDMAKEEFANRSTPETAAVLAMAYQNLGDNRMAKEIIDNEVMGKSSEPMLLLAVAKVYKESGEMQKLQELKEELLTTRFEMGPVTFSQVQEL